MYKLELKGIISIPKNSYDSSEKTISLTCCQSIPKITIGDKDLHSELSSIFEPDAEDQFEKYGEDQKPLVELACKYVILDNQPETEISFNDQSADVINGLMMPGYVCGCYSEYTCGYGDFDFFINQHSIFNELKDYVGKYIHLVI